MKHIFREHTALFITVVRWVVLATGIGMIVGVAVWFFLTVLTGATTLAHRFSYYYLLLPFALFVSALIIRWLAPDAAGHGTEKVIEAVHRNSGRIKAAVVPVKLVATWITLAVGGSAGKEGPCAQIGGGLASTFASLLRFDDFDRRKLVICGISAGFASVFGTPIAGAIFGVEVLFAGSIMYDVLLPSFVAGITSFHISSVMGVHYFYHPINFVPVFSEAFFAKIVLAGLVFGLCSSVLIETLHYGEVLSARLHVWPPLKGLIGGAALILLALSFSDSYLGLGLNTIQSLLQGGNIAWYGCLLKSVATSITLNFGGSGGIVTPIFFVGSAAGTAFANILGLDTGTFAAVGMVALLAGAANTPIAASILSVEMFGPQIAPYATVACVISFLMTGHRSVYPSQVLAMSKSKLIQTEVGKEMHQVELLIKPSNGRISKLARRFLDYLTHRSAGDEK